jgi:hypothetical protein
MKAKLVSLVFLGTLSLAEAIRIQQKDGWDDILDNGVNGLSNGFNPSSYVEDSPNGYADTVDEAYAEKKAEEDQ